MQTFSRRAAPPGVVTRAFENRPGVCRPDRGAAVTNDLMLIGSVFSNRIVVCDLSDSKEQALY